MRELFVWYHVDDERAEDLRAAVLAMQRSLVNEWPGLEARLLIRRGASREQTWMETYARGAVGSVSGGVDASLEAAMGLAAAALAGLIDSGRHTEAFELIATG